MRSLSLGSRFNLGSDESNTGKLSCNDVLLRRIILIILRIYTVLFVRSRCTLVMYSEYQVRGIVPTVYTGNLENIESCQDLTNFPFFRLNLWNTPNRCLNSKDRDPSCSS